MCGWVGGGVGGETVYFEELPDNPRNTLLLCSVEVDKLLWLS